MANKNLDWDDLGRTIQDAVDWAIDSHDFHKLSQTIRQTVETAVDKGGEALRKAAETAPKTVKTAAPVTSVRPAKSLKLYASTGGKTASGVLQTLGGGAMSVTFGGLGAMIALRGLSALMMLPLGLCAAGLLGAVWLTASGAKLLRSLSRFRVYRRQLGDKTSCSLEKLSRAVGKDVKFVRKDLWKMIDSGLFLEGHMDKEQTVLITSNETYDRFEQSRLQLEERRRLEAEEKARAAYKPPADPAEEVLRRGEEFIREIRRCNDDIPGEEVSAKIDRMELIVAKIFERAKAHPEIVPDLKKLMDYYLPMTVKLLKAYADMDAQPIQGETIMTSKREIEAALDTLNAAYEKLFDDVFADTALDVSSDISVLSTLLAQEGLVEDDLTKMKKQRPL